MQLSVSWVRDRVQGCRYLVGVATWDADAPTTQAVDYRLVQSTFVTMFWHTELLDQTVQWLHSQGYHIADFDTESWTSDTQMLDALAQGLDFPDYFGRNFNALNDCMRDVAAGGYGWNASETGLVIVVRGYETFAAVDHSAAQTVLDIFADQARSAMLFGNRIICLLQTNDPNLSFAPVGAMPVKWNDAEWLNSKRSP